MLIRRFELLILLFPFLMKTLLLLRSTNLFHSCRFLHHETLTKICADLCGPHECGLRCHIHKTFSSSHCTKVPQRTANLQRTHRFNTYQPTTLYMLCPHATSIQVCSKPKPMSGKLKNKTRIKPLLHYPVCYL